MRPLPLVLAAVSLAVGAVALRPPQASTVQLKIRAALVDADLNLKPVPRLSLTLTPDPPGAPVHVTTGFDGEVALAIPAGQYRVQSDRPTDFSGKRFRWDLKIAITGPSREIDLSNDNADAAAAETARVVDPLAVLFRQRQSGVVTVWTAFGQGTGFIVDQSGLVLTNQHVVGPSEYLAVQLDAVHKVAAQLLVADPEKDIAVLRCNLAGLPGAVPVPLDAAGDVAPVVVGEDVFTIGSPMGMQKLLTTGIVSKVQPGVILSNININHGNSGGPLFNSRGDVVGITTFLNANEPNGPGISGIITLEAARPLLVEAKAAAAEEPPPSPALLPAVPVDAFPLGPLKEEAARKNFETKPYFFSAGKFDVAIITPPLQYWSEAQGDMSAVRGRKQRQGRKAAAADTIEPLQDLKNWGQFVGEYQPVILIRANPQLRETFWSALGRGLAQANGQYSLPPARLRYATDFSKMRLFCGEHEVEPILPGKIADITNVQNAFARVSDATYQGLYQYPADSISPECGQVRLELYSEKDPQHPIQKVLSTAVVKKIWSDFQPYRDQETRGH